MRSIIAFAILLLGIGGTASEVEYSSLFGGYMRAGRAGDGTSLIEIESSTGRADRRAAVPATPPQDASDDAIETAHVVKPLIFASASAELDADNAAGLDGANERGHAAASVDELCNALYTSAQDNDLPIPFFANLIWQESRLRADDVSRKGAQGIAQFMPETASEKGLANPFDPMQALPASARFLRELHQQFGNLGFVAAAYNAGPRRVIDWLENRAGLPRETRNYVVRVTGLSVDTWRNMPVDNDALTFVRHLPCRSLPAYANVEQMQSEQAQLEEAEVDRQEPEDPAMETPASETPALFTESDDSHHATERGHVHHNPEHREVRGTVHGRRAARHEAAHARPAKHERGRSA